MLFFNQTVSKYLTGLLVGLLISGWSLCGYGSNSREIGVVDVAALNMRSGPGLDHPAIRVLEKGARVRIVKHEGSWLQILHDGRLGYISANRRYVKCYVIHTAGKSEDTDVEVARAKAREVDRKIRDKQAEVSGFEQKEKTVLDELEQIDRQLNTARRTLDGLQAAQVDVDARIEKIREDMAKTRLAIDKKKGYAQNRLVALYKLNRLGEMNLLATASSTYDIFRRRAAIQAVVDNDEKVIGGLTEELGQLDRLEALQKKKKAEKQALELKYRETLTQLAEAKAQRRHLLEEIKTKKSNRLATLDYLKAAARQLDKTLTVLNRQTYDARKAFSEYQGLLKMPVSGKVISKFGKYIEPRSGVASFRNGIEIRSDSGAPVRAVFDGKAIYADWLKGYGRVIIVAHGSHYYTVYAHVEDLFCRKGDTVEAGEVIATVGDTGSIIGPALYFEVRHHGNPVDPLAWIEKG